MTQLTQTQKTILVAASQRPDGNIEPLPSNINAGIKPRVIQGLLNRDLITQSDGNYIMNTKGFAAIDLPAPSQARRSANPREGTKQARMIALMQRPEGASIEEICQTTGWQKHTVRGTFSNTLKKRLGLTVTSYKEADQPRRYRVSHPVSNES
ncbi:MAG: DUF3489 domain-containing protein [Cellvibrionaceae bacterium]|nr:DUF3489 domain-containing protein [Cellvibrionaceae bacterium]